MLEGGDQNLQVKSRWLVAELWASWSGMERLVMADLGGVAPIVTSAAACWLSNSLCLDLTSWGCGGIWVLCFYAKMAWLVVICKDLVRHAWSVDDRGLYCWFACRVDQSGWMFPIWLERSSQWCWIDSGWKNDRFWAADILINRLGLWYQVDVGQPRLSHLD